MDAGTRIFGPVYWALTGLALAATAGMALFYAPVEATMGPIQKIFYLHMPAAINTFVAAGVVFAASLAYVWNRSTRADALADAAARVTVLSCSIVLVTGMWWARTAWGHWWSWSPRLTFSLILWLLFVVYIALRPAIESQQRRALVCAVYGIIAFLDVPLVYLSVKLLPDIHPSEITLDPAMRHTLLAGIVAFTALCAGLIRVSYAARVRGGVGPVPPPSPPQTPPPNPPRGMVGA